MRGGFGWVWRGNGGVVLGLEEAVGPPLWFAGPRLTWQGCGGVSVGAWVARGVGHLLERGLDHARG